MKDKAKVIDAIEACDPERPPIKTNTERVVEFMDWCPTGALGQLFVIEACTRYASAILKDKAETLRQMEHHFINGPAWVRTAEAWQATEPKKGK